MEEEDRRSRTRQRVGMMTKTGLAVAGFEDNARRHEPTNVGSL